MKTTSPEFRTHLDSEVTALCTCWKITRKDGVSLHFTDSDQDVMHDGILYRSVGAYKRSAIETTATLSVDNLEVTGMATDLVLPMDELRAGAYDYAEVEVFMTSWLPSVGGTLKLRRGFFGEVTVYPNGTFTVELRGLLQKLAHTFTDVYSATCRNDLGDSRCRINLAHPFVTVGAHIPIPYLDPDFEEVGRAGFGASFAWYNPLNEEELVDSGDTYSGVYAAHGSEFGGYIAQDIDITSMGEDFVANVDNEQVTLTSHAWRKDNGDTGRIRYQFLDHDLRERRSRCGSYFINGPVTVPEVRFSGDFTFETWLRPYAALSASNRNGVLFQNLDEGDNSTFRSFALKTSSSQQTNRLTYTIRDDDQNLIDVMEVDFEEAQNVWVHVALVRQGDTFRIYANGELRGEVVEPRHGDFIMDKLGAGSGYSAFYGELDEVRVWNRARTQAEINQYRFRDFPDAQSGQLQRYYPFDGDTNDYGTESTGALPNTGNLRYDPTPVVVAHRGPTTGWSSGFQNVGTSWTLVSAEDVPIPLYTRFIRILFDHQPVAGTPKGTRLDSLFGWFQDNGNNVPMPNFNVGENGDVWTRAGMVTSGGSPRTFRVIVDEPRGDLEGWYQYGLITFFSGRNAGASMEVKRWTASTKQVELFLSLPFPVEQGDLFTIYPGCDKSRIGCAALFNNIVNFFGTPDVPGEDDLFRYPDAR